MKRGKELALNDDLFQLLLDCETSPWFDKTIAEITTELEDLNHLVWRGIFSDNVAKVLSAEV